MFAYRNANPRVAGEKFPAWYYGQAVTMDDLKSAEENLPQREWNKLPVKRTP